jgi:hypothetical protein
MESHNYSAKMQKEMINEIESAKPKWIVLVGVSTSWMGTPDSVNDIIIWIGSYVTNFYYTVGIIDIPPYAPTVYCWDEQAKDYNPVSEFYVVVYKRKN